MAGVGVEGQLHARVPEGLGDHAQVDLSAQRPRCVAVTGAVILSGREPGLLQRRTPDLRQEVDVLHRDAGRGREDELPLLRSPLPYLAVQVDRLEVRP